MSVDTKTSLSQIRYPASLTNETIARFRRQFSLELPAEFQERLAPRFRFRQAFFRNPNNYRYRWNTPRYTV